MATLDYLQRVPTSILNNASGTNFGKLWGLFSAEMDEINDEITASYLKYIISTNEGENLNQIGKLINVPRIGGQSDEDYRISLYAGAFSTSSGGSIDNILIASNYIATGTGGINKLIEIFPSTIQFYTTVYDIIKDNEAVLTALRAGGVGTIINYSTGTDVPFVFSGDSSGLGFTDIGATGAIAPNAGILVEII